MADDPLKKRVTQMFSERQIYEALWDTAYEYIAPERAVFFRKEQRSPQEVGDEVFDSTAIDAAERLTNLILSRLTPPWQKWFRLAPGSNISDPRMREQIRPLLQDAEKRMFSLLSRSNFYQELQPMLLDRVVGGNGALCMRPDLDAGKLRFKCVPLAEIAVQEDNAGELIGVARKGKWSLRDLQRAYPGKLPEHWVQHQTGDPDKRTHLLYEANFKDADGQWEYVVFLDDSQVGRIVSEVQAHPYLLATRWTKIPGTPYGRGPGLRALADVRALNKIKELSLKNAAKAVAGVYTVVDDGVLNPYTLTFEPGSFVPVDSNDRQNPSIAAFPETGNFDVAMFQMEELKNSIRTVFMADQFGSLDRTPRSATEVAERTNIIAQELGSTVARMQHELLLPMLKAVFYWMGQMDMLPSDLELDGETLQVEFVSQLAQAQWAEEERNILEYTQIATEFGQVDSQAGLIIDVHKALRRVAEVKGIPAEILRNEQEIQQVMQQAAEAQAEGAVEPEEPPPAQQQQRRQ